MTSPKVVDAPLPFAVDRPFHVNQLVPTHRQLLLRSPMGDSFDERIDILFKGVSAMKLAFELPALEIRAPTAAEYEMITVDCGPELLERPGTRCYVISGGPSVGYVVALSAFRTADQEHAANDSRLLFDLHRTAPPETVTRLV